MEAWLGNPVPLSVRDLVERIRDISLDIGHGFDYPFRDLGSR
jgi:hypothetical protein